MMNLRIFSLSKIHYTLSLCLSELFLWWGIKNLSFIKFWNQVCDLSWKTVAFDCVWVPAYGFNPGMNYSFTPNIFTDKKTDWFWERLNNCPIFYNYKWEKCEFVSSFCNFKTHTIIWHCPIMCYYWHSKMYWLLLRILFVESFGLVHF